MQLYILLVFSLFTIFSIQQSMACMPHTPKDVFIARFQASQAAQGDSRSFTVQLSADQFIFRSWIDQFNYAKPTQWQSTFSSQNIKKDSLIIGLAYTPDGAKPEQYQIASFATLSCAHNQLSVSKPVQPFLAWNRQTANCAIGDRKTIGILDGFIQYDQSHYLAQLQKKYPTCEQLNKAFPPLKMNENIQHPQSFLSFKRWWKDFVNKLQSLF